MVGQPRPNANWPVRRVYSTRARNASSPLLSLSADLAKRGGRQPFQTSTTRCSSRAPGWLSIGRNPVLHECHPGESVSRVWNSPTTSLTSPCVAHAVCTLRQAATADARDRAADSKVHGCMQRNFERKMRANPDARRGLRVRRLPSQTKVFRVLLRTPSMSEGG